MRAYFIKADHLTYVLILNEKNILRCRLLACHCVLAINVSARMLKLLSTLFIADVNSWLVTFGFQLYNVIPGYHKPVTDAMEPSYELIHAQMKTQEWDSTKVRRHIAVL